MHWLRSYVTIHARAILRFAVATAAVCILAASPQPATESNLESQAFLEFRQHVQDYLKLQRSMPRLRTTKHREEISDRRRALARQIRETRSNAKPGDIFTPEINAAFRQAIRSAFQAAPNVSKTIRQGEPITTWHPRVNRDYPEYLPLTTVPPTLLLHLPQLPEELAYRIVGRDFVLQDIEARVVIDFIRNALP